MRNTYLRYVICAMAVAAPMAAQAPRAPAANAVKSWTQPKTPWGDPDIQGTWPGNMGVPMQRPAAMGTRTTLTDDEFKQRETQAQRQSAADRETIAPPGGNVGIGPPSYWTERGKPTRQTSLILRPP